VPKHRAVERPVVFEYLSPVPDDVLFPSSSHHSQGAPSYEQAKAIASQVSTSSLVKTAFYGEDANWGRILCAMSVRLMVHAHFRSVSEPTHIQLCRV
jgi:hypothetical protein